MHPRIRRRFCGSQGFQEDGSMGWAEGRQEGKAGRRMAREERGERVTFPRWNRQPKLARCHPDDYHQGLRERGEVREMADDAYRPGHDEQLLALVFVS
jgi:hypothetical protein